MRTTLCQLTLFSAIFLVATCFSANAESATSEESEDASFLKSGELSFSARLRYEFAETQSDATDDANALTLRSALSWKSGPIARNRSFRAFAELENTAVLSRSNFSNGEKDRGTAVVADPPSTEFNQLYLAYESPGGFLAKLGRQEISYGDERFVGSVAFRQNHQSFDALSLSYGGHEDWRPSYAYVRNVNRIFGDDSDERPAGLLGDHKQNTHLLNLQYRGWSAGELEAYGYFIDNKDFERASTNTWGARFHGSVRPADFTYLYTAEFARQHSRGSNPAKYKANYWRLEGGLSYKRLSLKFTNEHLGSDRASDRGAGFFTPFATLHKFQGWADRFVALTPNEGVVTNSLTLAGRFPGFRYRLQYHDFDTDKDLGGGSTNIGREFGLHIQRRIQQKYLIELKYADYRGQNGTASAPGLATDSRRVFLSFAVNFKDI